MVLLCLRSAILSTLFLGKHPGDRLPVLKAYEFHRHLSLCMSKQFGFPTRSDTNQAVQSQPKVRSLKEEE